MYSSTLPSTSALDGGGWSTPRLCRFTPTKDPVPIVQEAGWAPGPVWTVAENLAPHRDSIPGPPIPQRVTILTELSRPVTVSWQTITTVIRIPGHEMKEYGGSRSVAPLILVLRPYRYLQRGPRKNRLDWTPELAQAREDEAVPSVPKMARGKFAWQTAFSAVQIVISFARPASLYCDEYVCVCTHIHISDCTQTVYELPLLPNNTAVKHFYTNNSSVKR